MSPTEIFVVGGSFGMKVYHNRWRFMVRCLQRIVGSVYGYSFRCLNVFLLFSLGAISVLFSPDSQADENIQCEFTSKDFPKEPLGPCIGYDPDTGQWGGKKLQGESYQSNCADNYAFVAVDREGGKEPLPAYLPVTGYCCPIPHGVLTREHQFAPIRCPEQHVSTGLRRGLDGSVELRCTRLNSVCFRLGPAIPGQLIESLEDIGQLTKAKFFDPGSMPYSWTILPPALRFGLLRSDKYQLNPAVCVAEKHGALLIAKLGKRCDQHEFAQVVWAQEGNQQKPVKTFPQCSAVDRPFSTNAQCVP